jgi:GMP synthase (glutamine-hydrolysing)
MVVNMKRLYIIKAGTTFPNIAGQLGDFDKWTVDALGAPGQAISIVDAEHGAPLPPVLDCAGVIVTGSHAMVTDDLPWIRALAAWVALLLDADVPFFGICFGHQLLARAAGGEVDYHPHGEETGTVGIHLLPESAEDPLFRTLPKRFRAHATHSQTVIRLPPNATRLAANAHDSNHAIRVGGSAWGVQFHPEYDAAIMKSYLLAEAAELESAGTDVSKLLQSVAETPVSLQTLRNFNTWVLMRHTGAEGPRAVRPNVSQLHCLVLSVPLFRAG